MSLSKSPFGRMPDGTPVDVYTLGNARGLAVKLIAYGARVTELHAPDRDGRPGNVVLGFDNLEQYLAPEPFFGATVGRYANRIAGGKFTLDGVEYTLPINNGPNTLHGGPRGFDKALWKVEDAGDSSVRFTHASPDGDAGFPGNLAAAVTYTLGDDDALNIQYEATADKATPVNLTNHSYFNLSGAGSGDVLNHLVTLYADYYTPVDPDLIPTGEIARVRNTEMDFTQPATPESRLSEVRGGGYDHNYAINRDGAGLVPAARVHDPRTGRTLDLSTTQPGVQFYTGNFLDGSLAGVGGAYARHGAMCLETQHFPDSVHHPNFPNVILRPGQTYSHSARFRFSASGE